MLRQLHSGQAFIFLHTPHTDVYGVKITFTTLKKLTKIQHVEVIKYLLPCHPSMYEQPTPHHSQDVALPWGWGST